MSIFNIFSKKKKNDAADDIQEDICGVIRDDGAEIEAEEGGAEGIIEGYSEEEMAEYEACIEKNFGKFDKVFHEIFSPDIHLDVVLVPPTEEHNYYKLITMGMGAHRMNTPPELSDYEVEYAELAIFLPPDWNVGSSDEKDYWPIRYLKSIARLPINCDTWLGVGHTVHADDEQKPVAENTGFNSFVLLNAVDAEYNKIDFRLNGRKINFYQLFPLYQEELDFKLEHSLNDLLELFDDDDFSFVVDINRKNYGK